MSGDSAGFVGNIPGYYDTGLGPVIFVDYAKEMAKRVAALRPTNVLETAAGTGIVTRALRDRLPSAARLTATDLNAPMLDVAGTKFREGENVGFQPADAQELPFADSSFDAVVCQFGIMFYPDRDKSYREALRVLVPGGHYFFSVWDSHRYNPFGRIASEVAERFFPVDPPPFYRVPFSCHQVDPIKEALLAAGFSTVTMEVIAIRKEIGDPAAFARAMVFGNPLFDQIKARGGVDPERVAEAMREALEREFGPEPLRMPLQAVIISARKS